MEKFTCDALTLVVEVVYLLAGAVVEAGRGVARDVLALAVLAGVAGLTSASANRRQSCH